MLGSLTTQLCALVRQELNCTGFTSANQVETDTYQVNAAQNSDAPFTIFIF
jgi:hypothetical protein